MPTPAPDESRAPRPHHAAGLLSIDTLLFQQSCEVSIVEVDDAQLAMAELLAPPELTLEPQA